MFVTGLEFARQWLLVSERVCAELGLARPFRPHDDEQR
jgi:hypothetical protein